jgi:hypothetical protein
MRVSVSLSDRPTEADWRDYSQRERRRLRKVAAS